MRGFCLAILLFGLAVHYTIGLGDPVHTYESHLVSSKVILQEEEIPLRIMTYNIRYGKGIDGRVDLNEIAKVIEEANVDIVGLQEVEESSPRSRFINQTRYLAEELGMYAVFGPAISIGPYGYGNAILSRFPILSFTIHPVSSSREHRNFIKGEISIGGHPITFISTHLGLSHEERLRHVEKIVDIIAEETRPLFIVGDFNSTPDSLEVKKMRAYVDDTHRKGGSDPRYTFASDNLQYRIDYIFTCTRSSVIHTEIIESFASDHLPVLTEVRLLLE